MFPDGFMAPWWLFALLLIPILAVLYVLAGLRRKRYAVRFSNVPMLKNVSGAAVPGWRRHVAAVGLLLSLGLLVVAVARPIDKVRVAEEQATIILTIDTSQSMRSSDVDPTRMVAAQEAAKKFAEELPARIKVGLVGFSGTAGVLVPPTADRTQLAAGIDALQFGDYTAVGDGILVSLQSLKLATGAGGIDETGKREAVPMRIVLLSDGESTTGSPVPAAVEAAKAQEVPIYTIAVGTSDGTVELNGEQMPVPVADRDMRRIAKDSGGKFFSATNAGSLKDVYSDIGSLVGYKYEDDEVTARWALIAMVFLLLTSAGSLWWTGRLP